MELKDWLSEHISQSEIERKPATNLQANSWKVIRLFLSSTFVDTQAERDVIIKRAIPSVNRKVAHLMVRIVPVDLRWGVLAHEAKDCHAIQKTCLNQLNQCRDESEESPWFLGLRTERYGWVQEKLMESVGFEQPSHCQWIDGFAQSGRTVSITSLECIHASVPPSKLTQSPTVFFYKRKISNPEDVEQNLRWVFDYEYVEEDCELDPEVQFQYVKTKCACTYKNDKDGLDDYLKDLPHVKYTNYTCSYEKGGARFTSKNEGRKSFGVGYVTNLEDFEKCVETDLLEAIYANFKEADCSHLPQHMFLNAQHENVIKLKAGTFVGRSTLFDTCYQHCVSESIQNSVLIVHGEPGCGKSALMAALSQRCLDDLRKEPVLIKAELPKTGFFDKLLGRSNPSREHYEFGDFVFVHAVDSCPGSNALEGMLRRLRDNLCHFRKLLGEEDCSGTPNSVADLKQQHLEFLLETASRYPEKRFVVLIDAVNQFHKSLQAWKMWWVPSEDIPANLRFVISTLNEENNTFHNVCDVCPDAVKIPVEEMSYVDASEMVSTILDGYHKKLTTTDENEFLGNQMEILLSKNLSPLFLAAATQALRRFGIFEKVTEYITQLPKGIRELFSFLLDEWVDEYGEQLTKDVCAFLCLSRDGLLENQINDLLLFKKSEQGISYDSSFSRLYDAIASFLAAGGGGFLKFFHDQLKYEVKQKFLPLEEVKNTHCWLAKFFISCIESQLCEVPTELPPAYYKHCLQQVVHHQIQAGETDFSKSLRSIYFVRECIVAGQSDFLQQDYIDAIRYCVKAGSDPSEVKALRDWAKFAQIYSPHIKSSPEWAYNMGINQLSSSSVAIDVDKYPQPCSAEGGYPLHWINKSSAFEDSLVMKYSSPCSVSVGSTKERNMMCCNEGGNITVYEADSGVMIQQINVQDSTSIDTKHIFSIYLSKKYNTVWAGDDDSTLSVYDIDTGSKEWSQVIGKRELFVDIAVLWIENVGEYIACGTAHTDTDDETAIGTIAMIDETSLTVIKWWTTEIPVVAWGYCFHRNRNVVLSAHDGLIKCWNLDGTLAKDITVEIEESKESFLCESTETVIVKGKVFCLSASPTSDLVAMIMTTDTSPLGRKYCVRQIDYSTEEQVGEILPDMKDILTYDNTGELIICVDLDVRTIKIYNTDGSLRNALKGNSMRILDLSVVPDTNHILMASPSGCFKYQIPENADPEQLSNIRAIDVDKYPQPCSAEGGYPLYWINKSSAFEDSLVMKYSSPCSVSVGSTKERNMMCCNEGGNITVYEADSGVMIQQINVQDSTSINTKHIFSIYLSQKYNTVWAGDDDSTLSVYDIDTGSKEWSQVIGKRELFVDIAVLWIENVGEYIACGTAHTDTDDETAIGTIAMIDETSLTVIKWWTTEIPVVAWGYCFHRNRNVVLSAHDGLIKCWNLDGTLAKDITVEIEESKESFLCESTETVIVKGKVFCLSASPTSDLVAMIMTTDTSPLGRKYCVRQIDYSTEEQVGEILPDMKDILTYDNTGELIICVDLDVRTIKIYNTDGSLRNALKGNSMRILDLSVVPDTNHILMASPSGCFKYQIPENADPEQLSNIRVRWCQFIPPAGHKFVTLSKSRQILGYEPCVLQVWETSTFASLISVERDHVNGVSVYPDGRYLLVHSSGELMWYEPDTLSVVASFDIVAKNEGMIEWTGVVNISPNCGFCAVTSSEKLYVLDISDIKRVKHSFSVNASWMVSCDISTDSDRMLGTYDKKIHIWDLLTGKKIKTFPIHSLGAIFLNDVDSIIAYVDREDQAVHTIDVNGVVVNNFEGKVDWDNRKLVSLRGSKHIMTSDENEKSIRLHERDSGKTLYSFFSHQSEGFECIAPHPSEESFIGVNQNGFLYFLSSSRDY